MNRFFLFWTNSQDGVLCTIKHKTIVIFDEKAFTEGSQELRKPFFMSLLGWAEAQSHILTGDGLLNDAFPSFKEEELPHYHKAWGQVDEVFLQWRQERRRSLFGGFVESPCFRWWMEGVRCLEH